MLQAHPASLNAISYDAVIRCLQTISSGGGAGAAGGQLLAPCVTDIFIDTVGDPETYKQRLTSVLGEAFGRFVIEKKADAKYKVVSAASIIAKVTRDTLLRAWQWKEQGVALDKDFGSGYPGDDTCVRWVERARHPVFGFPNLVRFSWSTVRESLIKGGAAKVHWDCDEEDDAAATHKMTSFFSSGGQPPPCPHINPYNPCDCSLGQQQQEQHADQQAGPQRILRQAQAQAVIQHSRPLLTQRC